MHVNIIFTNNMRIHAASEYVRVSKYAMMINIDWLSNIFAEIIKNIIQSQITIEGPWKPRSFS